MAKKKWRFEIEIFVTQYIMWSLYLHYDRVKISYSFTFLIGCYKIPIILCKALGKIHNFVYWMLMLVNWYDFSFIAEYFSIYFVQEIFFRSKVFSDRRHNELVVRKLMILHWFRENYQILQTNNIVVNNFYDT